MPHPLVGHEICMMIVESLDEGNRQRYFSRSFQSFSTINPNIDEMIKEDTIVYVYAPALRITQSTRVCYDFDYMVHIAIFEHIEKESDLEDIERVTQEIPIWMRDEAKFAQKFVIPSPPEVVEYVDYFQSRERNSPRSILAYTARVSG